MASTGDAGSTRPLPTVSHDEDLIVPIRAEGDLGHARMVARETCKLVGLRGYRAQKVVTAVSELARNIARYTPGGQVRFSVDVSSDLIIIIAEDEGAGIANLDEIFAGEYRSRTGLGRGLLGSRELADSFDIETGASGTTIRATFCYGSGGKPWTTSTR